VQHLQTISSGISSFAKTLRLMAGAGLASEGFQKDQVGSSAMPHKQNARTSERISGLHHVLRGYGSMLSGLSGDQWNEGDVSCSVVRRVALPGAFFSIDGQLEAFLTVLNEMGFNENALQAELEKNLPFVCSTVLLMESVKRGGGREDAHHAIREHSLSINPDSQSGLLPRQELARRLGQDLRIPLDETQISEMLDRPQNWLGNAPEQAQFFVEQALAWTRRFPDSNSLEPEPLL
jgi:adenylosuccinate lyase